MWLKIYDRFLLKYFLEKVDDLFYHKWQIVFAFALLDFVLDRLYTPLFYHTEKFCLFGFLFVWFPIKRTKCCPSKVVRVARTYITWPDLSHFLPVSNRLWSQTFMKEMKLRHLLHRMKKMTSSWPRGLPRQVLILAHHVQNELLSCCFQFVCFFIWNQNYARTTKKQMKNSK